MRRRGEGKPRELPQCEFWISCAKALRLFFLLLSSALPTFAIQFKPPTPHNTSKPIP